MTVRAPRVNGLKWGRVRASKRERALILRLGDEEVSSSFIAAAAVAGVSRAPGES